MSDTIMKAQIGGDIAHLRKLNPDLYDSWMAYHDSVFVDGALSAKEKQLIAVAVAHITACPYCIRSRVRASKKEGASDQEIVESIYVGLRLNMGGPFAFSSLAFEAWDTLESGIPLTEGHFFKKDIAKEIASFRECSGDISPHFMELHKKIFADGALSKKMKRGIIGLACAHATKCPYCIRGTVKDAHTDGVTAEQMAEAINVAMVMTAGSCYAHTSIAMDTLKSLEK